MVEVLLYVGLALYLASRRPLRDLARALARPQRAFLGALFACLVAGQLLDDGALSFPFVPWSMYTQRASGNPSYREYRLRLASGREEALSAFGERGVLSVQMHHRLESLAAGVERAPDAATREQALESYERALRSVAAGLATRFPRDRAVAIEVRRVTVPLRSYSGPASLRREPFHRLDLR